MPVQKEFSTTAVVGSGYMGGGIAQVLALAGYRVALGDVDEQTAELARIRLNAQAVGFEARGLLPPGAALTIDQHLHAAETIEAAVNDADFIVEAVPEVQKLKLEVLKRISRSVKKTAIIGSNTSAIPINVLARAVNNPERFLGVHWMNPAPFVPCVELISSTDTSPETAGLVEELLQTAGKISVRVADTPGFVANRLQFALYKEAARMVEEGVADPKQIDTVVSNSFGFRLALFGPFAIGDMAGLDVYTGAYETLEQAYGKRFEVPASLANTVASGNLGLKSGRGYLDIDQGDQELLLEYRDMAYARLSQLRAELGAAPGL